MSREDFDALLVDYVLGALAPAERQAVELELARNPDLARNLLAVEEALAAVAWAQEPLRPPSSGRARLIEATRTEETPRFAFVDRLARFFDLSANDVRALWVKAASPVSWEPAALPGMFLFHLIPGPRFAGTDAGLVRFDPGVTFPMHEHLGAEQTFMIEGGLTLDDGQALLHGQDLIMPAGSRHGFTVGPAGCLYALLLQTGVDIPGLGRFSSRGRPL